MRLLHILHRRASFVCVEPLRQGKLPRPGGLTQEKPDTESVLVGVTFQACPSLHPSSARVSSLCLSCEGLGPFGQASSSRYVLVVSCTTNVIRRMTHYAAWTYQSWRPAESVCPVDCSPPRVCAATQTKHVL